MIPELKNYWLSASGGKVSLLRRSDGKRISVAKSDFSGNSKSLGDAVYQGNYVYYQISIQGKPSKIYRFPVSAKPTAEFLYEYTSNPPGKFAVDKNGNMVVNKESENELVFLEAKDGKIDTDNSKTLTSNGKVVSGLDGKIYLLKQNSQTKVELHVLDIAQKSFQPITKKGGEIEEIEIDSANGLGSEVMKTDTAIFIWVISAGPNGANLKSLLRLVNGKISKVGLPQGIANVNYKDVSFTQTSKYLYALFKAGGKGVLYRVGDKGDFLPVTLRNVDVPNVYTVGYKTGFRGEVVFAAKDNNGHWIIELKRDGTEKRRTKAKGKVVGFLYLSF